MGFLIRGGISIGRLFHSDNFIFGDALIKAYELESKYAKYPRIILDDEVIEIATKYGEHSPQEEEDYYKELVTRDDDGWLYLDYFEKAMSEFDNPLETDKGLINECSKYISNIEKNFLSNWNSKDKKNSIYEKLFWLSKKISKFQEKLSNPHQN